MNGLVRVARVEARLRPHRWAWADENADAIAAIWDRRRAAQPSLFDGRVLMVAELRQAGETVQAAFFETGYARLLAHIELGFPDPSVLNGFAMGVLRGSDGGLLLGLMAPHTANAGRLYFPAGTPDLSDVLPDGTVDLAGSILREIREETGLPAGEAAFGSGWSVVAHGGRLAFLREVWMSEPAEAVQKRIRGFLAAQPEPELSDILVLRPGEPFDDARMPSFLPVYLSGLARAP